MSLTLKKITTKFICMLFGSFSLGHPPPKVGSGFPRYMVASSNPWCKLGIILLLLLPIWTFGQFAQDSIYLQVDKLALNKDIPTLQQIQPLEQHWNTHLTHPDDRLALLVLQCNMGYYFQQNNLPAQAINYYENAWQNQQKYLLSGYDIIEYCLKPLGNLYTRAANYTQAENTIKTYIDLAEKSNQLHHKLSGILNLSVIYHHTHNYPTAVSILQQALHTPHLPEDFKSKLENNLAANLIALGESKTAEELLLDSESVATRRNQAQLALQHKQPRQALIHLTKALELLVEEDFAARDLAKIYIQQATVYQMLQQPDSARILLQKAQNSLLPLDIKTPEKIHLYPESTFITLFDSWAAWSPTLEEALYYYDLSFYVSDLLAESMVTQEAKMIHYATLRNRSEKCVERLFEVYQRNPDPAYLEKAFQYAEQTKSRVLKEMYALNHSIDNQPDNAHLIREKKLLQLQENYINQLVKAQLANNHLLIQPIIDSLNQVYFDLQNLKKEQRVYTDPITFPKTTIQNIQLKLGQQQAEMYSYFYGTEHVYRFDFSAHHAQLVQLAATDEISEKLRSYFRFFDSPHAINDHLSEYKTLAWELYQHLMSDPLPEKLIIVPDGLLNFLPFETLLTQITETTQYAAMDFVINACQVVYSTSAGFYAITPTRPLNANLLGVFPVFQDTSKSLIYSLEEAQAIKNLVPATLLLNEKATKVNFLEQATNYSILHFSTHAHGGSFVTPAGIEFYDSEMIIYELYGADFKPELVVLSACDTGIGKLQKGEGAMSLARAFQYLGTEKVLFTLWQVNDQATALWMSDFYSHLARSKAPSDAQYRAKSNFLTNPSITNAHKSPYYWGSFVYYGTFEEINISSSPAFILVAVLLSIAVLVLLIWRKRKRNRKNH